MPYPETLVLQTGVDYLFESEAWPVAGQAEGGL